MDRSDLSKMERGRMIPTEDEFARAVAALEEIALGQATTSGAAIHGEDPGSPPPGSSPT